MQREQLPTPGEQPSTLAPWHADPSLTQIELFRPRMSAMSAEADEEVTELERAKIRAYEAENEAYWARKMRAMFTDLPDLDMHFTKLDGGRRHRHGTRGPPNEGTNNHSGTTSTGRTATPRPAPAGGTNRAPQHHN